jgi:predicted dehydrogenase
MAFIEGRLIDRSLRWGMVGGGTGSQIGYAHRSAARRDEMFELKAAVFDIDAKRGREFGERLGLDENRCYAHYPEMFSAESNRPDGIEVVSVATPNDTHYEICKAALEAGLHVICEKPLTLRLYESLELRDIANNRGLIIAVMYGYAGFPMLHQARAMVNKGDLGDIRLIQVQFPHGYHAEEVELNDPGLKWRVTEEKSGPTYVLGDTGAHCLYLAEFVTGKKPESLCCARQSFIKSRAPLEDNAHVMIRYEGDTFGTLWASAINIGSAHDQRIRVVGSKMSIEWCDEHPNQLIVGKIGEPLQIWERGMEYLHEEADFGRIGGGHAEGFFESWANLYSRFGRVMDAKIRGKDLDIWYPDIEAGIAGLEFIEACVESDKNGSSWVEVG